MASVSATLAGEAILAMKTRVFDTALAMENVLWERVCATPVGLGQHATPTLVRATAQGTGPACVVSATAMPGGLELTVLSTNVATHRVPGMGLVTTECVRAMHSGKGHCATLTSAHSTVKHAVVVASAMMVCARAPLLAGEEITAKFQTVGILETVMGTVSVTPTLADACATLVILGRTVKNEAQHPIQEHRPSQVWTSVADRHNTYRKERGLKMYKR